MRKTQDMDNNESPKYLTDENGLIMPKKLANPCLGSRELQNVHREIKWNAKKGVNVLSNKSELKLAMEKRNRHRIEIEKKIFDESNKTPFQRVLEERAKKLSENSDLVENDSGHSSPEPENEFLKVHAQLRTGKSI